MPERDSATDTRLATYGTVAPGNHWARLDEFEGTEYRRVVTQVRTVEGDVPAALD